MGGGISCDVPFRWHHQLWSWTGAIISLIKGGYVILSVLLPVWFNVIGPHPQVTGAIAVLYAPDFSHASVCPYCHATVYANVSLDLKATQSISLTRTQTRYSCGWFGKSVCVCLVVGVCLDGCVQYVWLFACLANRSYLYGHVCMRLFGLFSSLCVLRIWMYERGVLFNLP